MSKRLEQWVLQVLPKSPTGQAIDFTIASASVMCVSKSEALVGLALPALALGIPIFDTLFSMLRRFLERRSLFAPDRSHFHHRLLELGLNQRRPSSSSTRRPWKPPAAGSLCSAG